jgi:hypothetical protein
MTNRDPYDRRMGRQNSVGAGMIAVFALIALFVIGGLWYAASDRSNTTATGPATSTSTTGQGGSAPSPNAPNPSPRAPGSK